MGLLCPKQKEEQEEEPEQRPSQVIIVASASPRNSQHTSPRLSKTQIQNQKRKDRHRTCPKPPSNKK